MQVCARYVKLFSRDESMKMVYIIKNFFMHLSYKSRQISDAMCIKNIENHDKRRLFQVAQLVCSFLENCSRLNGWRLGN